MYTPKANDLDVAQEALLKAVLVWTTLTALWHWVIKDWAANVKSTHRRGDKYNHPHAIHHVSKGGKHGPNVPTAR
jgi:hypothetical protein